MPSRKTGSSGRLSDTSRFPPSKADNSADNTSQIGKKAPPKGYVPATKQPIPTPEERHARIVAKAQERGNLAQQGGQQPKVNAKKPEPEKKRRTLASGARCR